MIAPAATTGRPRRGRAERLAGHAYVGLGLLKEGLHNLTGTRREASLPATLFTISVLVRGMARFASPRVKRSRRPAGTRRQSRAEIAMGLAVAGETVRAIAGVRPRETPFAGAIIALSLLAPALRMLARRVQSIRAAVARFMPA